MMIWLLFDNRKLYFSKRKKEPSFSENKIESYIHGKIVLKKYKEYNMIAVLTAVRVAPNVPLVISRRMLY